MFRKKIVFSQKVILLLSFFFLLIFKNQVFGFRDNEFYEITIRGTEIIHVALPQNANCNDVLNYIQKYINLSFNGDVSSISSYNSERNDRINWNLKDSDDDLISVYFDDDRRPKRNHFYDFIDLRWLGNGSPHMYCFWKMDDVSEQNLLEHKNMLQLNKFNDVFWHSKLTDRMMKKVLRKMLPKIMKKIPTDGLVGKTILSTSSELLSEQVINLLNKAIEGNSKALDLASKIVHNSEQVCMGAIKEFDGTSVSDCAAGALDFYKAYSDVMGTPVEVVKKTGQNIAQGWNKMTDACDANDFAEGLTQTVTAPLIGTVETGYDTLKNIGYHTIDGIEKVGQGVIKATEEVAEVFNTTSKAIRNWFDSWW